MKQTKENERPEVFANESGRGEVEAISNTFCFIGGHETPVGKFAVSKT